MPFSFGSFSTAFPGLFMILQSLLLFHFRMFQYKQEFYLFQQCFFTETFGRIDGVFRLDKMTREK